MFKTRSTELERIDTGDYTPEEYATFLHEIRLINRYLGDARALRKSLFKEIEKENLSDFSVLDVACGSGELLRETAKFARRTGRSANLTGIDLHELSFTASTNEHESFNRRIAYVRGDAFHLPFPDGAYDYVISSLFLHHLTDDKIPSAVAEMSRVARRGVFAIDLHRHPAAYVLYKLFCFTFRISSLVLQDGSLSILRGFRPDEASSIGKVKRIFPFRLLISTSTLPLKKPQ